MQNNYETKSIEKKKKKKKKRKKRNQTTQQKCVYISLDHKSNDL